MHVMRLEEKRQRNFISERRETTHDTLISRGNKINRKSFSESSDTIISNSKTVISSHQKSLKLYLFRENLRSSDD